MSLVPALSVVMDLCMLGLCYASHWQAKAAKRPGRFWVFAAAATVGFLLTDTYRLFHP